MPIVAFKIHGMDCAEEVAALKAEVAPLPGVRDLAFDLLNGKMTVEHSASTITPDTVVAAVAKTGMRAEPWQDADREDAEPAGWARWSRSATTAASGLLLVGGVLAHVGVSGWRAAIGSQEGLTMPLASRLLYLGAVVAGGWHVFPKSWRALVRLRPDMNLLMTIAVGGALLIDEFFEAATVAFLFAVSLTLESWSVARARRAIGALMSLSPDTARLVAADGTETVVDVQEVPVGAAIVVRPGDKFPLDGRISKGETTVNQAPVTGESMPVPKARGSEVFAGTINQDGAVEVITTKPAGDTTLARIIRMVGDAQSKRSPSEQWVERFARYYTPAVMILALAVMILPPLVLDGGWSQWFYQGLVLLVIACPCALVISTPVSIVAALAASASHGVLVKGGPYMEAPARLNAVALDKTGTLTVGRPEVLRIVPLSGHSEAEVLAIAAAVEARSEHPLAAAIVREAGARGIRPAPADGYQAMKGKGATATLHGRSVWLGSHRLLEERGQETPQMHAQLENMEQDGASVVVVGEDRHVCALIAMADRIRPNARAAVQAMRAAGIQRIVMLTGDNRATGEAIGREAGVDEVHAELLPEDKVAVVEQLVSRYGRVAMVGDGVNDAPAMARASLGIAMGAAGTDAALETADIALMGDDLLSVAWLVRHSRHALRVIRQNIFASLLVKAVFVLLTLAGHASLWAAIAADMGASLLVIFNGLRLLKPKARPAT
ncbi:MAG: heavy metal translocating P-type ATPase [Planctomycetia bacterium]|nr:heavy metal translocating P-type ATPase [Planctomycetia bacterium]